MHLVRKLSAAVAVVCLAVGAAACGGSDSGGGSASSGGRAVEKPLSIKFVGLLPKSDPFFRVVNRGLEDAADDLGVDLQYVAPPQFDVAEYDRLITSSIASKPDALLFAIISPSAENKLARQAVDAGIPHVMFNAGQEEVEKTGSLGFVGQDEFQGGVEAGERMKAAGVTEAFCGNGAVGARNLDARCAGFAEGLKPGTSTVVPLDPGDPTGNRNKIKALLQKTPDLGGFVVTGPQLDQAATDALADMQRTGEVKYGLWDLTPKILKDIKAGTTEFAIDQQPYLEGYDSVKMAVQWLRYGIKPVSPIITGPAFVTQENVDEVIKLTDSGIR